MSVFIGGTLFSAPLVTYVPEFGPAEQFVRRIGFPDTEPRALADFIVTKAECSRVE